MVLGLREVCLPTSATCGPIFGRAPSIWSLLLYRRYYECEDPEGDQLFSVSEHDCGDWFFDPALSMCVDPDRPGNEGLCPEEEAP